VENVIKMHGTGHNGRLPPVVERASSGCAGHGGWYQRHGAGSKGQGADGTTAPPYRLSVLGCAGDTPASRGTHSEQRAERRQLILTFTCQAWLFFALRP